ncbi:MAG TPA: formate/nitrite transporter family protein, partial [Xanthobacteraceae bacterium]|nr:formate/nitrite transporter family protein [Xanthobacteraceae bacterium]
IMLFFGMTFEHSIVNMFLFPSGLIMGGKFSIVDYLIWNEIPTVVGNLVGGLAFTGLTLYATHVKTAPKRAIADGDYLRRGSSSLTPSSLVGLLARESN